MATIEELLERATQIKNETSKRANTANRLGSLLHDVIEMLSTKQGELDYVPENIENKTTSLNEESTNDQYPTARAVNSELEKKINNGDIQQELTDALDKVPSSALMKVVESKTRFAPGYNYAIDGNNIILPDKDAATVFTITASRTQTAFNLMLDQAKSGIPIIVAIWGSALTTDRPVTVGSTISDFYAPAQLTDGSVKIPAGGAFVMMYINWYGYVSVLSYSSDKKIQKT